MAIIGVGGADVAGDIVDVEAGLCAEVAGAGVNVNELGFDCRNKGFGSGAFSLSGRRCLWLCTRGRLSTCSGGRGLGGIGTRRRFRFRGEVLWQEDDESKNAIKLELAFAFKLDVVWASVGRGKLSAIKCCSSTFDRCSAASFRLSSIQR